MTAPLPTNRFPEERRLATVLFADVQGFTSLSEQLDSETVSDLIKDIWLQLDKVIEAHGGYIDKHIGDAVMAVWGAPYGGDNDAEQAVMAALALQVALKEFCVTSSIPSAHQLKLRVGINTGLVFACYVGLRDEYTVIGDTVNVANRIEQSADADTVMIGEGTFRLVRGAFRIRKLTTMSLRGRSETVPTFLVESVLATPGRVRYGSIDSMRTVMVGREREVERLKALYQVAYQAETPTMVLLIGETGIGKSRLMMEFTSQLEVEDPALSLISARALAQAAQVPFFLWKLLLHNWVGLKDDDLSHVASEKFLREIYHLWGRQLGPVSAVEAAHFIGGLIGLMWPNSPFMAAYQYQDDPQKRVQRAFELMRELLRRVSVVRPAVLLLDDIHWADKNSLELLSYLLEPGSERLPLLILAAARPEFLRQQPNWNNLAQVLLLPPLMLTAETVSEAYPDLHGFPHEVLTALAKRAEGNPYFLEEMVKSLVKTAFSETELSTQEMLDRLRMQLPESLRAMLQARLDDLTRESRSVILLASVVGRVFWVGAVVAAARGVASMGTGPLMSLPSSVVERVIQDGLRQLVRAELVFPRANSSFSDEQEYIFKHSLLRDVAYSLIPTKYIIMYHRAVAHWLSTRSDPDYRVMAADHYELAGAFNEAAIQCELAAQHTRMRGASEASNALLERARLLADKEHPADKKPVS